LPRPLPASADSLSSSADALPPLAANEASDDESDTETDWRAEEYANAGHVALVLRPEVAYRAADQRPGEGADQHAGRSRTRAAAPSPTKAPLHPRDRGERERDGLGIAPVEHQGVAPHSHHGACVARLSPGGDYNAHTLAGSEGRGLLRNDRRGGREREQRGERRDLREAPQGGLRSGVTECGAGGRASLERQRASVRSP
jgi:hypothetical protein